MQLIKILLLFITLSQSFNSFSQEPFNIIELSEGNKGKIYIFGGWNRVSNYLYLLKFVVYLHPKQRGIEQ